MAMNTLPVLVRSANPTVAVRTIRAVIIFDGQERLFVRHFADGCLLATEN